MIFGPQGKPYRVYVRPGITDMRKQINGLAVIVEQELGKNPLTEGALFCFCNRTRKILKVLYWDATGFCLWQKRLEKHRFPWPQTTEQVREITSDQLSMLLSGIDFWHAHEKLTYSQVH